MAAIVAPIVVIVVTNLDKRAVNLQKIIPKGQTAWYIMDFTMDIDKLNLLNLVGMVMDEIMEYQIFLPKCTER